MENTAIQQGMDLEKHIIVLTKYRYKKLNPFFIESFKEDVREGIPSAIGYKKDIGYFVLHAGQGPYLAYKESDFEIKLLVEPQ